MEKFIFSILLATSFLLSNTLPSNGHKISMRPYNTNRLVPWNIFFYDIEYNQDDPSIVDLVLFDGVSGNSTSLFDDPYDLSKRNEHKLGFDVPVVPAGDKYTARILDSGTKRLLAESLQFNIFAGTSGPSSAGPSGSTAGSPSSGVTSGGASTPPPGPLPTPSAPMTITKVLTSPPPGSTSQPSSTSQPGSGHSVRVDGILFLLSFVTLFFQL